MLPPFLGALLLLGTAGLVALSVVLAVFARVKKNTPLFKRALYAGGGAVGLYGFFWLLGLGIAMGTGSQPAQELRFCGLDCHLHVSVAGIHPGSAAVVTVRFSSNALQAPEWPKELRFRLRDSSGHEFAPTNQVPDRPLLAGESWNHDLEFPAGANPSGAELIVTWKPGLDYFVPGSGNPLVQRYHRLALPNRGTGA
ncbi:MAG TPA: hypothetical protein VGP87_02620 [Gemmatimonadales bacterium]|jgi:hypothetical protein|nr:hypothetical protein [Gemmatimonadales bacterium]